MRSAKAKLLEDTDNDQLLEDGELVEGYSAQQIMKVLARLGLPSGASQLVQTRNVVPGLEPTGEVFRNYKGLVKLAPGKYGKKPVRCYTSLDCMVVIWAYITSCREPGCGVVGLSGRLSLKALAASGFTDQVRETLHDEWDYLCTYYDAYKHGKIAVIIKLDLDTNINQVTVDISKLYHTVRKELEEVAGIFHTEIGDYEPTTDN